MCGTDCPKTLSRSVKDQISGIKSYEDFKTKLIR